MSVVKFILSTGDERDVEATDGDSVMHTAVSNLVPGIVGECGGEMSCATCHVYVDKAWLPKLLEISDDERDMLEVTAAEPDETSRLCCQITCGPNFDGIIVRIPEVQ